MLKVDETGTEAAAVTSIEVRLTSVPVRRFSFKADRPFLLAIRDDETGAVLFVGCDQRSAGRSPYRKSCASSPAPHSPTAETPAGHVPQ